MGQRHPAAQYILAGRRAFLRSEFKPDPNKRYRHPWYTLAVGEHFDVPSTERAVVQVRRSAARQIAESGRVFAVSKTPEGCRVTRTD